MQCAYTFVEPWSWIGLCLCLSVFVQIGWVTDAGVTESLVPCTDNGVHLKLGAVLVIVSEANKLS